MFSSPRATNQRRQNQNPVTCKAATVCLGLSWSASVCIGLSRSDSLRPSSSVCLRLCLSLSVCLCSSLSIFVVQLCVSVCRCVPLSVSVCLCLCPSVWVCLTSACGACVCAPNTTLPPPHALPLSSPPLTLLTPLLKTLLSPWMAWMTVDDPRVARAVRRSFVNELHPDVLEPLVLVGARRPDLDERANSPLVRFHPRNCLNLQQRSRSNYP